MLEAKGLQFRIGERYLLQDFTMSFAPGNVYALVGHNGSGKSTLIKLLARQQKPTDGEVLLQNKAAGGWSDRAFARHVAYLPQHLPATGYLSARELVSFGRYPWHGLLGRLSPQDVSCIGQAMSLTNTTDYAERLVETLSGGERQRIWLAMLLAQRSRYLLLDEPVCALDIAHQVEVLQLIKKISPELGLGVILVIHDINMAARFCEHIVALHSGRLIAAGSATEIFTESWLKKIYGIEMRITDHPAGYPVAMPC